MTSLKNLLQGKRGIITGIANDKSIAWPIAELAASQGAELCLTYQGELLEKRIKPLAAQLGCDFLLPCDVTDGASMDEVFKAVKERWGNIDFIVHSIAFSDKSELKGKFLDTSLANFQNTMNISCFSLVEFANRAQSMMNEGGSIIALTYHGAQQVVPNYNVMGVAKAALECSVKYLANDLGPDNIRVNAISAGPIRTLAASGIGDFRTMLKVHAGASPLRRNTTQNDVAGMAGYLLSDLSSGVTGGIHYVDSGFNIMACSAGHETE